MVILNKPKTKEITDKPKEYQQYTAESVKASGYLMDDDALYSWIELYGNGGILMENISESDDSYYSLSIISNGWSFPFYETLYNNIYVSSNGYMTFGYKYPDSTHGDIPGFGADNSDTLALVWEDLSPEDGGSIYYMFGGSASNRYLVIEYYQVVDYNDKQEIGDCEVILFENGSIKFQYKNLYDHIYPTIGVDHGDFVNFNIYDPELPISSKAIQFNFDEMKNSTFGLKVNTGNEFDYLTDYVNHGDMEKYFGANWEANWGIYPGMNAKEKMKINITSITDNNTHWDIDYEMWKWTEKGNEFTSNSDSTNSILIRQNPSNYLSNHFLPNYFPLILPNNTAAWLAQANLDDIFYEDLEYYENVSKLSAQNFTVDGRLTIDVHYDEYGVLDLLDVRFQPFLSDPPFLSVESTRLFRMARIFNFTKPFYVGVNEGEVYEYEIFFNPENAPPDSPIISSTIPQRMKIVIGIITGEDLSYNRTLIFVDIGFKIDIGSYGVFWATNYNERFLIYRDIITNIEYIFRATSGYIMPTNVNYSQIAELLENEAKGAFTVEPLANGFRINNPSDDEIITYIYKSNGVLEVFSLKYKGKEYYSYRLIKDKSSFVSGDDDDDDDEEIEFFGPILIIVGSTSAIGAAGVTIYLIRKRRLKLRR